MTYDQALSRQKWNNECGIFDKAVIGNTYVVYKGVNRKPIAFELQDGFRLFGLAEVRIGEADK